MAPHGRRSRRTELRPPRSDACADGDHPDAAAPRRPAGARAAELAPRRCLRAPGDRRALGHGAPDLGEIGGSRRVARDHDQRGLAALAGAAHRVGAASADSRRTAAAARSPSIRRSIACLDGASERQATLNARGRRPSPLHGSERVWHLRPWPSARARAARRCSRQSRRGCTCAPRARSRRPARPPRPRRRGRGSRRTSSPPLAPGLDALAAAHARARAATRGAGSRMRSRSALAVRRVDLRLRSSDLYLCSWLRPATQAWRAASCGGRAWRRRGPARAPSARCRRTRARPA